jgi:hypothetical protein
LRIALTRRCDAQRAAEESREAEESRMRYVVPESPGKFGSSGACGGLFPAAGIGASADGSCPSTPLPEPHHKIREAASVSRIKGSGYGSINVHA